MTLTTTQIIFIIVSIVILATLLILSIALHDHIKGSKENIITDTHIQYPPLSFDQCNEVLFTLIDDIYKNKYFLQYRLKDIVIIPKMDQEIEKITKEIYSGLSDHLKYSFSIYYSEDYVISMITRKVQLLLVEYTNTYKPSTK